MNTPIVCPARFVRLTHRISGALLFCVFVPVFVIAWSVLLMADARQKRRNAKAGEGELE